MKGCHNKRWALLLCAAAAMSACPARALDENAGRLARLKELSALDPIDAHAHVQKSDAAIFAMMKQWHLHVLDILVVDDKDPSRGKLSDQRTRAFDVVHASHGHVSLCTSFDPFSFSNPDFQKNAIAQINEDFAHGAVAVKVWKNVGMELKDKSGHYVLVDDARLAPIFKDIAAQHKTLVAHQAEPDVAWGPPNPKAIDNSYYAEHPEWNMMKVPDAPKKAALLAARDHLLAQNKGLRVVGAHLGSMEADVDMVAQRLDRYPNFAVDTAARVEHLTIQPSAKVRAFLIKYQDRVLYGTDVEVATQADGNASVKEWEDQLALDWRYFSTADRFDYNGHMVEGLHLPGPVLRKLFHENAVRWIPGILPAAAH